MILKLLVTIFLITMVFGLITAFLYMSQLLQKYDKITYPMGIILLFCAFISLMLIGVYIVWE